MSLICNNLRDVIIFDISFKVYFIKSLFIRLFLILIVVEECLTMPKLILLQLLIIA